ncbi:pyridoxal phosphate-dependent decarboxylase family protein [Belnapia moabensis]|uniref:pyridoxal phosphate-dependent decarboxylase family protein n=1 Tax=Belnapia moabensis TaxID=365533 RepID=UPI0006942AF3|nr:aminotransferase class I/II-fold pyridoxal phosphate-dependent enzyme [Belnapia moabensis]
MSSPVKASEVPDCSRHPADTLGMPAEDMRRLGYKVVDLVVERLIGRDLEPAILTGTPEALMSRLDGGLPEAPVDPDNSLDLLVRVALAHQQHGDHPRYFARVPGPSSFAAVLGEWLGTGFNAISASWGGGSGPSTVELVALEWLRQFIGLPPGTEGVLVSGGSLANLTAFAAARTARGSGVAYLTDQAHASLPRSLRGLGFAQEQVRTLESDANLRMPPDALLAAIAKDRRAGRHPFMVVASGGTTNAGTIDPLPEIARICKAENLWFHVDGAYGAPAAATAQGRRCLAGIEHADSLVLDPHKWLFQPYDVGCVFVSRPGTLERCFALDAEYLRDVTADRGQVDFRDRSLELTRRARALKLWMTFRTYGCERLRAAIRRGIALAEFAEACLRGSPATWEVVVPAQIGIVCFALRNAGEGEHARRAKAVSDSGYAAVSSTMLKSRSVLRLCTINPLTTEDDIAGTIDRLARPA